MQRFSETTNGDGEPVYQELIPHQTLGQIAESFHDRHRQGQLHREDQDSFGEDEDEGEGDGEDGEEGMEEGGAGGGRGSGGESTGRWTRHEHELFLEALKKYGKEWKKVASMVKTRTVVQTRTHAQKYFQKLAKSHGGGFASPDEVIGAAEKASKRSSAVSIASSSSQKRLRRAEASPPAGSQQQMPLQQHGGGASINHAQHENYFPLGSEVLTPFVVHGSLQGTPLSQESGLRLRISLPPPSRPDFPQPSPAACGRRKHAELTAAEMLAGSAQRNLSSGGSEGLSYSPATYDAQGVHALSRMRGAGRSVFPDLSLSITDPDHLLQDESLVPAEPGTPWDDQVAALCRRSAVQPESSLPRSSASRLAAVSVATPSEQRQFLDQVRALFA
eukprot:gene32784-39637_t